MLTVAQLIVLLAVQDPDLPVFIKDEEYGDQDLDVDSVVVRGKAGVRRVVLE